LAQDDYYYEIQLTNKQLVFYFLAGATGLILSFLAGVMVGRGVDQGAGEVQAARPIAEERVVSEETPKPAPPAAEDLTYAQRLENEKAEEARLERPKGGTAAGSGSTAGTPPPTSTAAARPAPTPAAPGPVRGAPPARPAATLAPKAARPGPAPGSGNFTIQVGAFKDRASADSVVARLKTKGFAAYVVSPEGEGLFNVRVGNFPARADAERIQGRLRDEEKFKPFIVKQ
jgi:DedD protein